MHIQQNENKNKWLIWVSCLLMAFSMTNSYAAINAFDLEVNHPPIPILDEQGTHVVLSKQPYSPKKTCAGSGCHDYEGITHAYHFEMGRDEADDEYGVKRGLPHLVSPGYYGGYTCMGGSNPQVLAKKNNGSVEEFADYGSAGWLRTCMDCHVGGGWAEKDRNGIRYDQKNIADINPLDGDYYDRVLNKLTGEETVELWDWKKSGVGEADCLFCHMKYSKLALPVDSGLSQPLSPRHARRAFVKKGFFRQAASATMEYVKNDKGVNLLTIARAAGDFVLDANGMPVLNWHPEAFTKEGRVIIPMLRFPENASCMECHLTSNTRRGFYGFGEEAKQTLASADEGDGETPGAGSTFADDYRDDVHKGTNFTEDNGQQRSIESCNSCHSVQYYKPLHSNVDLNANHNFPKGNSDMDVRNDLDYRPNVKSCEKCHIHSVHSIVGASNETLLKTHTQLWASSGGLNGYAPESLTAITQRHFDVVACQTCHITNKKDANGNELQMMYRYRVAEDGLPKISPYNPRLRYHWKDKASGRVLYQKERNSVLVKAGDAKGVANIVDPVSQQVLGQISGTGSGKDFVANDPNSYESFVALKTAYDSLLRRKGYVNPNTSMVFAESNEYVISHNTRPKKESMPCRNCHTQNQNGGYGQFISDTGVLGKSKVKVIAKLPDTRLVSEGIVTLGVPYNKLQPNGEITQNVADVLYETKIDSFMSLLKNSSSNEITGEFIEIKTKSLLAGLGSELSGLIASDFTDVKSFYFTVNKGSPNLRNMGAIIPGNAVNNVLFPKLRIALGIKEGVEKVAQDILHAREYGNLRSRVFYIDVLDEGKGNISSFNGSVMLIKAAYKGEQTDINKINVVIANRATTQINSIPSTDIVMLKPANEVGDGFVIFKMKESGYFIVADK
ncbi:MAG: cytochrome C [Methylococcales bacterium]|nr:cytochrome C [Methylococcales bacterium]